VIEKWVKKMHQNIIIYLLFVQNIFENVFLFLY